MNNNNFIRSFFSGIFADSFTITSLTECIIANALKKEKMIIGNHNQHSLYLFYKEPIFHRFYSICKYVHIDGMSLIWLSKLYGKKLTGQNRITYVDLLPPLLKKINDNKLKVFYLGSTQMTIDIGIKKINEIYTTIQIEGHCGFFDVDSSQNEIVVDKITKFNPDILMVGMSMPRQELWIANNYHKLPNAVILPSGAALDYIAGTTPTPPRIAGKLGLEWLFRMIAEPRRLWRRYLIEPVFIVKCLIFAKKIK